MSAILEATTVTIGTTDMQEVRQFALSRISARLAAEPHLVSACWAEIGEPAEQPTLTVVYCAVRRLGQTFALYEFVAGETLEELVKRSDPAACELEIPLFCRILDAFESPERAGAVQPPPVSELELLDFGIGRATPLLTSKLHGAVLTGPDESCDESVFGELGASRVQVFAPLMALAAKLPGGLPWLSRYGAADAGTISVRSLGAVRAAEILTGEPALRADAPPVPIRRSLARTAMPYLIALATMVAVLLTFYGVGGFLARRTIPADAGKLLLPAMPVAPPEPDLEIAPAETTPPAGKASKPETQNVPRERKRSARPPAPSIVLARGAKPLRQTDLAYPVEAAREHVTGLVEMEFTIAEDGSVRSPRVLSGDPLLRAGLTEEVSHWVYQPMRVNGKPVSMTTEMALRFNLN